MKKRPKCPDCGDELDIYPWDCEDFPDAKGGYCHTCLKEVLITSANKFVCLRREEKEIGG